MVTTVEDHLAFKFILVVSSGSQNLDLHRERERILLLKFSCSEILDISLLFQDFKSKMDFQRKVMEYFGDVTKHMRAALKTLGANELNATYTLGGSLCKHCAPIIYVQVSVTNHEQFTVLLPPANEIRGRSYFHRYL